MTRAQRKALHRNGEWPKATPYYPTRRRLGDPPGFYKLGHLMKEPTASNELIQDQLKSKRLSA